MTQQQKIEILVTQALHAMRLGGPMQDNMNTMMRHGLALIAMAEAVEAADIALHCYAEHYNEEYGVFWKSDADAMNAAVNCMLESLPLEVQTMLDGRVYEIPANDTELRYAS